MSDPGANLAQIGQGNPLATYGQFAYAQNAMVQNQLLQQQFRAKQALGPLMQQAIDPKTGQMDPMKAITLVASHPEVGPIAPEVMNQLAEQNNINKHAANEELENARERANGLGAIWLGASGDPNVNSVGDLVSQGYVSQAMSQGLLKDGKNDEMIAFLSNPQGVAQYKGSQFRDAIKQHGIALLQGGQALETASNNFVPNAYTDAQGNSYPAWVRPYQGQVRPAGAGFAGAPSSAGAPGSVSVGATGATTAAQPTQAPVSTTPGAPAPQLTLRQPGEQLQGAYKLGQTLDNAATSSRNFMNVVDEGEQLLNNAMTGRALPTRLEIGRWATAAGVDEKTVDQIVGGSSDATQALQKLILYIGTQGMRQANEGNAAVRSVQEWNKFMEANPNLSNDPGAIRRMWDFMRYQNSLVLREQQEYYKWRDSGKDLTRFQPSWNNFVDGQTTQYLRSRANVDWNKPTEIGQ